MKKVFFIALTLMLLCVASTALAANHPCDVCGGATEMVSCSSNGCSWYCAACDYTTSRNHDPNSPNSYLNPNSCSGSCIYCGTPAVFSSHTFTTYVFDDNATCTVDSTETAHCDNVHCSATHTRYVAGTALGHDPIGQVIAPTCEYGGYTIFTCQRCGEVYEGDFTPPNGHSFGPWTPIGDGMHSATCTVEGCGYTTKAACSVMEVVVGGQVFNMCLVCGDSTLVSGEPESDVTVEPLPGTTLPRGKLSLLVDPAPFEEPIDSPALYMIIAAWHLGGQETVLTGPVRITVDLSDKPFVIEGPLADVPVTELTAEQVKIVRVKPLVTADGNLAEDWVDLVYTLNAGVLTFETDELGVFLMVPADAVSPYAALNAQ